MSSDDSVNVRFGADTGELNSGVDEVKNKLDELGQKPEEISSKFEELGKIIVEAFAVDKLVEFIDRVNEVGEQIQRTVAMTALSAEQVQTLGFALEMTGGDANETASMMARLERNILQASAGAGPAYEAFQRMGISLNDIRTKSPYEIVQLLADAFQKMGPSIQRTADMTIIGGRGFIQMAAALGEGSAGLEKFQKKLEATGALMTGEQAEAFAESAEQSKLLSKSYEGLGISIYSYFKPAIDDAKQALIDSNEAATNAAKEGGSDFQHFLQGAATSLEVFIAGLREMKAEYLAVSKELGAAIAYDAQKLNPFADQGVNKAIYEAQIADYEAKLTETINNIEQKEIEAVKKIYGVFAEGPNSTPPKDEESGGGVGMPLAPATPPDYSLDLDDIATDEKIAKLKLDQQRDMYAQLQAMGLISKQQMIDLEKDAADQEYTIELAALQQKAGLYDEDSADYAKAQNEMLVLAEQHNVALAKLNEQAAVAQQQSLTQTQKAYKSVFDTIDKDMDQMLNGVLQGTQTWQQAMMKLWSNLALSIIDDIAKMALKWAAFQGASALFGSGSGIATALGAQVPGLLGGTQGAGASVAQTANTTALTTLTANLTALEAALGIQTSATGLNTTANFGATAASDGCTVATTANAVSTDANTVGSAASDAVTALNTAVTAPNTIATVANTVALWAGKIGSFLGFDVGTSYVPQTGLAMIHQGEIILPPDISAQVRSGQATIGAQGGFGGTAAGGDNYNINFTIQAIDTQSGSQFLKQNAATIAQVIAGQMRNQSSQLSKSLRTS